MLDSGESIMDTLKVMHKKGMKRVAAVKNVQLVGMLTEDATKKVGVPVKTRVSGE